MLEAVGQADVLDEVGRVRQAGLAGPVVEDLEPRRARHEVDPVTAEVGVRVPGAVVERECLRRVGDGPLDDVSREQDALALGVEREPVLEEPATHLGTADLHPDLGEHPLRFVEDPADEGVVEDGQSRPHRTLRAAPVPGRRRGREPTARGRWRAGQS